VTCSRPEASAGALLLLAFVAIVAVDVGWALWLVQRLAG
jgi:hypothetical protein